MGFAASKCYRGHGALGDSSDEKVLFIIPYQLSEPVEIERGRKIKVTGELVEKSTHKVVYIFYIIVLLAGYLKLIDAKHEMLEDTAIEIGWDKKRTITCKFASDK